MEGKSIVYTLYIVSVMRYCIHVYILYTYVYVSLLIFVNIINSAPCANTWNKIHIHIYVNLVDSFYININTYIMRILREITNLY